MAKLNLNYLNRKISLVLDKPGKIKFYLIFMVFFGANSCSVSPKGKVIANKVLTVAQLNQQKSELNGQVIFIEGFMKVEFQKSLNRKKLWHDIFLLPKKQEQYGNQERAKCNEFSEGGPLVLENLKTGGNLERFGGAYSARHVIVSGVFHNEKVELLTGAITAEWNYSMSKVRIEKVFDDFCGY